MARRRLLLAGSFGPERLPARPDREDADWYLPLHLRDEHGARERIAAQIAAGADVVVAPTWLTHRRALLPLGETRQARAWTTAAVEVARQAVELGLERRQEQLVQAESDDLRRGRPAPLLAASLPALEAEPELGDGRLLPWAAASQRDQRDQAGLLAEAEPDLLLVEGQRDGSEARMAISEALGTGLPVWAALTRDVLLSTDLEAWLDWASATGVARLILPPSTSDLQVAAGGELPWGGHALAPALLAQWLDAGADVVAVLDGAEPAAIEQRRKAIDDHERTAIEAGRVAERRWLEHVSRAASMAPGGAAAWLGTSPATPLPDGFEWLVVDASEARHLPDGHYRLVVVAGAVTAELARLLERGGILAGRGSGYGEAGLQVLIVDDSATPVLVIYRREI